MPAVTALGQLFLSGLCKVLCLASTSVSLLPWLKYLYKCWMGMGMIVCWGGGRRYYGRGPLVRQGVASEFSDKLVEVEHLLSLEQEGWCLMKEAFPARKLG